MPQVSIIVPARNVQEYIEPLLDDFRKQTFSDIEVILVDDGSTDSTRDLISKSVTEDRRFRMLNSGGEGVSAARNLGIDDASGEFLAFVDADDRISPNYVELLHRSISETGSDLVSGNALRLEGYQTSQSILHRRACAKAAKQTHLSKSTQLIWDTTVWNKLWRREMWDRAGIRYAEGRWLNDFFPCMRGHVSSRSVDVITDVVYYWRIRTDPTTSITDSRLTDPIARLKSFNDRMFAMGSARRMLAQELPVPTVLNSFDSRLLRSDLPIYLPYYTGADHAYRNAIVDEVQRLLIDFQIDPDQFELGGLLRAVYKAIINRDHDRLEQLLSPTTSVRPSTNRRQYTAVFGAPAGGPLTEPVSHRRGARQIRTIGRRLGLNLPALPAVRADARIDRIHRDRRGTNLVLEGVVRIREGRSDIAGDWNVTLELSPAPNQGFVNRLPRQARRAIRLAQRMKQPQTRLNGPEAVVAPQPDSALHPLVRSGWRPFTATIDLGDLRRHRERRWCLRLILQGEEMALLTTPRVTGEASRYLPGRLDCGAGTTAVPMVAGGSLLLRAESTACHLVDARSGDATRVNLRLRYSAATAGANVWWQTPEGRRYAGSSTTGGQVELTIPDVGDQARLELWAEVSGRKQRVAADPSLRTVRLGQPGDGTEIVVRPTAQGRVVLEMRTPQLEIDRIQLDEEPESLLVGGSGLSLDDAGTTLVLRCPWTDRRVNATVNFQPSGGWYASIAAAQLLPEQGASGRAWSMQAIDGHGASRPLRVAVERRHEFPLTEKFGGYSVQVRIAEKHSVMLRIGGEGDGSDRWRQLRKVQRSASGAGIMDATSTQPTRRDDPDLGTPSDSEPNRLPPSQVDALLSRLSAPQRSRSRTPLGPPSFRYKMDERIRRRRYLARYTDAVPVTQIFLQKLHRDRIITMLGFPLPPKLLERGHVQDVMRVLEERDEVVIKPVSGSVGRGVYLLRRDGRDWLDLRTEKMLTAAALLEKLQATRVKGKAVADWQVEELVVGNANTAGHPMDYKLYMFQDQHGITTQVKRQATGPAYQFYDADWQPIDIGRDDEHVDPSLPLPEDVPAVEALARQVAEALPTPFARIDILAGANSLYIGEVTLLPGRYHRFADALDQRLGLLWDIAQAKLTMSFPEDPRFGPVLDAIQGVTGISQVYPD